MNRLMNSLTPRRLWALLIGLPLVLACVYYGALAKDRFVSTSVITIKRASHDNMAAGGLAMLISGSSAASHEDTLFVRDYIRSLGLLRKLDAELQLRAHYESARNDPFYRLWPQASQEWMLTYWRSRVVVSLDELSGLLTVRVEGFDPDFAQRINRRILTESEAFVNAISQQIAQEQMRFAADELERASHKLDVTRAHLLKFQFDNQVLDPMAQAQAVGALNADLRGQMARLEAELSTKRAYLQDDAPDVVSLKHQVAAVRQQIARETKGATQASSNALNTLAVQFHELKARAGFAEDAYKVSLTAVESARIEGVRKVKSLVVIEPSTPPELAEYPRRLYNLLTVFVGSLLFYALVRLALATIHEHRD
jgi:capsular polysaccharide transport system permease protein